MGQAQKCPVCEGSGTYSPPDKLVSPESPVGPCHGCDGKGWVAVSGQPEVMTPTAQERRFGHGAGSPVNEQRPTDFG